MTRCPALDEFSLNIQELVSWNEASVWPRRGDQPPACWDRQLDVINSEDQTDH